MREDILIVRGAPEGVNLFKELAEGRRRRIGVDNAARRE